MAYTAWPPRGSAEPRAPGSDFHMTRGPQAPARRPPSLPGWLCFPGFARERDCSRNLSGDPSLAEVVALVRDPGGEEERYRGPLPWIDV